MPRKLTLCRGKHLRFVKLGSWEYVERPGLSGIVAVVAVTAQKRLLLVEQFRPPVGQSVLELPAGLAGDIRGAKTEKLIVAAQRELLEETGYYAASWKELFAGPPSAGVSSEVVTFFLASNLRKVSRGGGAGDEQITIHEVPIRSATAWLRRKMAAGLLIDPKVYAGLYFATRLPDERERATK